MADGGRALRYAGVPVQFPYTPYRAQNALMHAVVTAGERGKHALLESPTGTGKSLALLCGALAWQKDVAGRIEARKEMKAEGETAKGETEKAEVAKISPGKVHPPPTGSRRERREKKEKEEGASAEREDGQVAEGNEEDGQEGRDCCEEKEDEKDVENDAGDTKPEGKASQAAKSGEEDKDCVKIDWDALKSGRPSSGRVRPNRKPGSSSGKQSKLVKKEKKKKKKRHGTKVSDTSVKFEEWGDDAEADFQDTKPYRDVEWQKHAKLKRPRRPRPDDADVENAHLVELFRNMPGGFQADSPLDSDNDSDSCTPSPSDAADTLPKKVPRIFYATRTHNQVAQIVLELRKTVYRPTMTVLASRREYCVRDEVRKLQNRNEVCKGLVKVRQCVFARGIDNLVQEPELKGEVWDIEDLNTFGKKHHGCPYYASRELYKSAEIIFCPYNFILDKRVRAAAGISIKGDIVLLDEAHNIESFARESASFSADVETVRKVVDDLGELVAGGVLGASNGDLAEAARKIIGLFERLLNVSDFLLKDGMIQHFDWEYSLREKETLSDLLEKNRILPSVVEECRSAINLIRTDHDDDQEQNANVENDDADKENNACCDTDNNCVDPPPQRKQASAAATYGFGWDSGTQNAFAPSKKPRLSQVMNVKDAAVPKSVGFCLSIADELVTSLEFYFDNSSDFAFAVERRSKDFRVVAGVHLWCLNAAVSFAPIASLARSIIVTSGTLSPLHTFAGELGTTFDVAKSMPHVIDVRRQLFVGVASRGPTGAEFDATFRGSSTFQFQDELGAALFDYCRAIPAGVLVFLPSYRMLEKLRGRWQSSGALAKLTSAKGAVFFEPSRRGDEFDQVMSSYAEHAASPTGAVLFGVCRGKLSEGIDFKDEAARGVIVVGIPFPHSGDLQILRKRAWNDGVRREEGRKDVMSGSEWYEVQAYRALNQALGRTIRHRFDYGAIILVDRRFRSERVLNHLPGWTRAARPTGNISHDQLVNGLGGFFGQVQDALAEVAGVGGQAGGDGGAEKT